MTERQENVTENYKNLLTDILIYVVPALIAGLSALAGSAINVKNGTKEIVMNVKAELKAHNEIQDQKIESLTEAVNRHNHFASTIPVMNYRIDALDERVKQLENGKE